MHIVVVEDEDLAADYLIGLLKVQQVVSISQITHLASVQEMVSFFSITQPDLIFMDIHLGDGKSLEAFTKTNITAPIIFTTAYDDYAISVFKHFTIDYLLKPFEAAQVDEALQKYTQIKKSFSFYNTAKSLEALESKTQKDRFLVNSGHHLKSIESVEVAFFYSEGKNLFLFTTQSENYLYNDTLRDISEKLNPEIFFKVSRNYIIHINSIKEIVKHNPQKIEVRLKFEHASIKPILVSKFALKRFKTWLNK